MDRTINWSRSLNLGKNFFPYRTRATADGGVIAAGYHYKKPDLTPSDVDGDRDGLILKFDALGNLVNKIENPDFRAANMPVVLSPNPSDSFFRVKTAVGQQWTCQIFNQNGQLCHETKVENEIDIRHLPAGLYYLAFLNEQGFRMGLQRVVKI